MRRNSAKFDHVTLTIGTEGRYDVAYHGEETVRQGKKVLGTRKITKVYRRMQGYDQMGARAEYRVNLSYDSARTFMVLFEEALKRGRKDGVPVRLKLTEQRWGYEAGQRDAFIVVEAGYCGGQTVPEQRRRLYRLEIGLSWESTFTMTMNGYNEVMDIGHVEQPWAAEGNLIDQECSIELIDRAQMQTAVVVTA